MKDIFKSYKRSNLIKNLWILTTSLVIALWINFIVLDSEMWNKLKASVLDSGNMNINSDIYFINSWDKLELKTNKSIKDVETFSLTLVYNSENIRIEDINSSISNTSLTNLSNEEWLNTVIINFDESINIEKQTSILNIKLVKEEEKTEWLNIINANFKDKLWDNYLLSTSWIKF